MDKGFLFAFLVLMLPVSYAVDGPLSYFDEIYVLIVSFFALLNFKRKPFKSSQTLAFVLIAVYFVLGLIGNMKYGIASTKFSIFVDLYTSYKQFIVYFFSMFLLSKMEKINFLNSLKFVACFYILIAFVFGLFSQFVDLSMTNEVRYGIKAFYFLTGNNGGFGISIIGALLVLGASNLEKRTFLFFVILGFGSIIFTTKGTVYLFVLISVLLFFFGNGGKISFRQIVVLSFFLAIGSIYQIKTYFLDYSSPRMVFIFTSVLIAVKYFPLGTGFATFGGEQAKVHYSPLYYEYGMNNVYGLNAENPIFLNDNYMAMILGQTGFFGLLSYFILIVSILLSINANKNIYSRIKIFSIAALVMMFISSIATGVIKTANGVFIFSLVGILATSKTQFENKEKILLHKYGLIKMLNYYYHKIKE